MRRNAVANLAEDGEVRLCWVDVFVFHVCRVADLNRQSNTFSEFLEDGCDPGAIYHVMNRGDRRELFSKMTRAKLLSTEQRLKVSASGQNPPV